MNQFNHKLTDKKQDRRSFLKWFFLFLTSLVATTKDFEPANAFSDKKVVVVDLPFSKAILTDASSGAHFRIIASRNFFLANPINAFDGQRVVWEIIQDRFGGHTVKLDDKFIVGSDLPKIILTKGPHKRDFMTGVYNAASDKWYVVAFLRGY